MSQDTVGWEAGQGLPGGAQSVLLNSLPRPPHRPGSEALPFSTRHTVPGPPFPHL